VASLSNGIAAVRAVKALMGDSAQPWFGLIKPPEFWYYLVPKQTDLIGMRCFVWLVGSNPQAASRGSVEAGVAVAVSLLQAYPEGSDLDELEAWMDDQLAITEPMAVALKFQEIAGFETMSVESIVDLELGKDRIFGVRINVKLRKIYDP